PVTAPSGIWNCTWVSELPTTLPGGTTKAPIFTIGFPAPTLRFVPLTLITVPLSAVPLGGANPVIFGSSLKIVVVFPLPAGFVTLRVPVVAPSGTTTFSDVAVTAVGVAGIRPGNNTRVAPVRFVPAIVTWVPTPAAAGVTVVGFGG